MQRNKDDRQHRGADAAVFRIASDPHHHHALALSVVGGFLKRLTQRALAVKKCFYEGLVDNGRLRIVIAFKKISAAEQRDLHGLEPTRRDVQEIRKLDTGGPTI